VIWDRGPPWCCAPEPLFVPGHQASVAMQSHARGSHHQPPHPERDGCFQPHADQVLKQTRELRSLSAFTVCSAIGCAEVQSTRAAPRLSRDQFPQRPTAPAPCAPSRAPHRTAASKPSRREVPGRIAFMQLLAQHQVNLVVLGHGQFRRHERII